MLTDSGARKMMMSSTVPYHGGYNDDIDESAVLSVLFQSSHLWENNWNDSQLKDIGNKYLLDHFLSRPEDKPYRSQILEKIRKQYLSFEESVSVGPAQLDIPKENQSRHKTHQLQCVCCGSIQDVQCPFPWKELTALRSSNRKLQLSLMKLEGNATSRASQKRKGKGSLRKKSKIWRYKPCKLTTPAAPANASPAAASPATASPATATNSSSHCQLNQIKVKDMVTRGTSTSDLLTNHEKVASSIKDKLFTKPAAVDNNQPLETIKHINVGRSAKKKKSNKCVNDTPNIKGKKGIVPEVNSEKVSEIPKSARVFRRSVVEISQVYALFLIKLQLQNEVFSMLKKYGSFFYLIDLKSFWDEDVWEIVKTESICLPGDNLDLLNQSNTVLPCNRDFPIIPIFKISQFSQCAKVFCEVNELPVPYAEMPTSSAFQSTSVLAEFKTYGLLVAVDSPEFLRYKRSLLQESIFSEVADKWGWLRKRFDLSSHLREDLMWKYICEELDAQKLCNVFTEINYCLNRVSKVSLEITDTIYFVRFAKDRRQPLSGLRFIAHTKLKDQSRFKLKDEGRLQPNLRMTSKKQSKNRYFMTADVGTQSRLVGVQESKLISALSSQSLGNEQSLNDRDVAVANLNGLRKKLSVYSVALDNAWRFVPRRKPSGLAFHSVKIPHKMSFPKNTVSSQKLEMKTDEQPQVEEASAIFGPIPVTEKETGNVTLALEGCIKTSRTTATCVDEKAEQKASSVFKTTAEVIKGEISRGKDVEEFEDQSQLSVKKKIVRTRRVKIQTEKHLSPTFDGDQETSMRGNKCGRGTKRGRK